MCDGNLWSNLYIVGLTGGIATGKSTVSDFLARLGAHIIDADKVAHEVTLPGTIGFSKLVEIFGSQIVLFDGSLDRNKLGQIVFNDKQSLNAINSIVHPLVTARIHIALDELNQKLISDNLFKSVVLDVPLLFETRLDKICDEVWVVKINLELQIERLKRRDGYTDQEAMRRIKSQMDLMQKIALADEVIDNTGNKELTQQIVFKLWYDLNRKLECRSRTYEF